MAEPAGPGGEAPADGPLTRIKVKTLQPATHEVEVPNNMLVTDFKELLAGITEVPVERQRLIYRGHVLRDGSRLDEEGIQDGHSVHLVEGQPQGGSGGSQQQRQGATAAAGGNPWATAGGGIPIPGMPGSGGQATVIMGSLGDGLDLAGAMAIPVAFSGNGVPSIIGADGQPQPLDWDQLGRQLGGVVAQQVVHASGAMNGPGGTAPTSGRTARGGPGGTAAGGRPQHQVHHPARAAAGRGAGRGAAAGGGNGAAGGAGGPNAPFRSPTHALASVSRYIDHLAGQQAQQPEASATATAASATAASAGAGGAGAGGQGGAADVSGASALEFDRRTEEVLAQLPRFPAPRVSGSADSLLQAVRSVLSQQGMEVPSEVEDALAEAEEAALRARAEQALFEAQARQQQDEARAAVQQRQLRAAMQQQQAAGGAASSAGGVAQQGQQPGGGGGTGEPTAVLGPPPPGLSPEDAAPLVGLSRAALARLLGQASSLVDNTLQPALRDAAAALGSAPLDPTPQQRLQLTSVAVDTSRSLQRFASLLLELCRVSALLAVSGSSPSRAPSIVHGQPLFINPDGTEALMGNGGRAAAAVRAASGVGTTAGTVLQGGAAPRARGAATGGDGGGRSGGGAGQAPGGGEGPFPGRAGPFLGGMGVPMQTSSATYMVPGGTVTGTTTTIAMGEIPSADIMSFVSGIAGAISNAAIAGISNAAVAANGGQQHIRIHMPQAPGTAAGQPQGAGGAAAAGQQGRASPFRFSFDRPSSRDGTRPGAQGSDAAAGQQEQAPGASTAAAGAAAAADGGATATAATDPAGSGADAQQQPQQQRGGRSITVSLAGGPTFEVDVGAIVDSLQGVLGMQGVPIAAATGGGAAAAAAAGAGEGGGAAAPASRAFPAGMMPGGLNAAALGPMMMGGPGGGGLASMLGGLFAMPGMEAAMPTAGGAAPTAQQAQQRRSPVFAALHNALAPVLQSQLYSELFLPVMDSLAARLGPQDLEALARAVRTREGVSALASGLHDVLAEPLRVEGPSPVADAAARVARQVIDAAQQAQQVQQDEGAAATSGGAIEAQASTAAPSGGRGGSSEMEQMIGGVVRGVVSALGPAMMRSLGVTITRPGSNGGPAETVTADGPSSTGVAAPAAAAAATGAATDAATAVPRGAAPVAGGGAGDNAAGGLSAHPVWDDHEEDTDDEDDAYDSDDDMAEHAPPGKRKRVNPPGGQPAASSGGSGSADADAAGQPPAAAAANKLPAASEKLGSSTSSAPAAAATGAAAAADGDDGITHALGKAPAFPAAPAAAVAATGGSAGGAGSGSMLAVPAAAAPSAGAVKGLGLGAGVSAKRSAGGNGGGSSSSPSGRGPSGLGRGPAGVGGGLPLPKRSGAAPKSKATAAPAGASPAVDAAGPPASAARSGGSRALATSAAPPAGVRQGQPDLGSMLSAMLGAPPPQQGGVAGGGGSAAGAAAPPDFGQLLGGLAGMLGGGGGAGGGGRPGQQPNFMGELMTMASSLAEQPGMRDMARQMFEGGGGPGGGGSGAAPDLGGLMRTMTQVLAPPGARAAAGGGTSGAASMPTAGGASARSGAAGSGGFGPAGTAPPTAAPDAARLHAELARVMGDEEEAASWVSTIQQDAAAAASAPLPPASSAVPPAGSGGGGGDAGVSAGVSACGATEQPRQLSDMYLAGYPPSSASSSILRD